ARAAGRRCSARSPSPSRRRCWSSPTGGGWRWPAWRWPSRSPRGTPRAAWSSACPARSARRRWTAPRHPCCSPATCCSRARSAGWLAIRDTLAGPIRESGYGYIEPPIFEHTELFVRGVGESTDIVSKEMYTFTTRGGDSLTLRPEGTAGVLRAVLQNGLHRGQL